MTSIREQLEKKLETLCGYRRFGMIPGLDATRRLLTGLGNPQNAFRSIHIAGTNGKGSTAALISAVLISAGYRVGRYTSPHLERFNERICVDDIPASDEELLNAFLAVESVLSGDRDPTFFEFSTAMAFHEFARRKVDWAVVEAGMGGRLDATNVLTPDLCIITNIALEHRQYLGGNLREIAGEKAGIIKSGVPVLSGVSAPADDVIRQAARAAGANLLEAGADFRLVPESVTPAVRGGGPAHDKAVAYRYEGPGLPQQGLSLGLRGRHQEENAALAAAACGILKDAGLTIRPEDLYAGLARPAWPGRLEYFPGRPPVLLDGAHNPAGAAALSAYLKEETGERFLTLILAVLSDKDAPELMAHLAALGDRMILTSVAADRALSAKDLSQSLSRCAGRLSPDLTDTAKDALALARAVTPPAGLICVAGSLYLIGEMRSLLIKEEGAAGAGRESPPR